jgi:hypothetical protein
MNEFAQIIDKLEALQGEIRSLGSAQGDTNARLDDVRSELQALRARFDAQPETLSLPPAPARA